MLATDTLRQWAEALGFASLGVADVDLADVEGGLRAWLAAGAHGEMDYMARHGMVRARPGELVPGTVSAIMVTLDYAPDDPDWIEAAWRNLSQLNQFLIHTIATQHLRIQTIFQRSADIPSKGKGQDRVLSLLKSVQADVYVSGPAGQAYLDPERFRQEGIGLMWKDYSGYPEYPQFYPPFEHAVTILDLLFHVGPSAPHYIWGWRQGAIAPAAPGQRLAV